MSKSQLRTKPILRIACITAISLVLSGCGSLFSGTGPAKRQIFTSQSPSLLEVLGSVGGLVEQRADARGVFVFRVPENIVYDEKLGIVTSDAKPMVFYLDMTNPVSMFLAREFLIYPDDAVYVTNAHMYESQKMISSIVQVLVLGSTIDQL